MKKIALLIISILIFTSGFAKRVYVSNSGSDSHTGLSRSQAVLTLAKAETLLAKGDILLLERGDVWNETFTAPVDSITIVPFGSGANPVISGFTTITGWTDEGSGLYSKSLTTDSDPEIVTINNVQFAMGRTPNADRFSPAYADYYHIDAYSGDSLIIGSECNSATNNWTGAEIVVRSSLNTDWTRYTINSHSGTTLEFTGNSDSLDVGYGYFIQNDIRTLDNFGEWYYNDTTGTFYMYFGAETPGDYTVKVSATDDLIDLAKKDYITIRNIKFEGANVNAVGTDYAAQSTGITINNCDFDFNFTAVYGHWTNNATVTNCRIMHSSDRGIYLHYKTDGYYIANNVIDSTGLIPGATSGVITNKTSTGISATYAYQSDSPNKGIIEYNKVLHSGFYGISFGGDSAIARYNYVDGFCEILCDGGGIHKSGTSINADYTHFRNIGIYSNIIVNSPVHDDTYGLPSGAESEQENGVYIDVYSFQINIWNNIVSNVATGIYILGGQQVSMLDNKIYDCIDGFKLHKRQSAADTTRAIRYITMKRNEVVSDNVSQNLVSVRDLNADSLKVFGVIDSNYYSANFEDLSPFVTMVNSYTPNYKTFNLWNVETENDANSYFTANTGSNSIFDFNTGNSTKTVSLGSTYMLPDSTEITGYSLNPYTGIIAFKDTIYTPDIDSLYAYYPLDGNVNDTLALHNGSNSGAVAVVGKFGAAYDFDTNTDLISISTSTNPPTNDRKSYSFWIKLDQLPSAAGSTMCIAGEKNTSGSWKYDIYITTANTLSIVYRDASYTTQQTTSVAGAITQADVWYYIVLNLPATGYSGEIYINGVKSTGTYNDIIANGNLNCGTITIGDVRALSRTLNGKIDEFSVFNCWRTANEILWIYDNEKIYPFE